MRRDFSAAGGAWFMVLGGLGGMKRASASEQKRSVVMATLLACAGHAARAGAAIDGPGEAMPPELDAGAVMTAVEEEVSQEMNPALPGRAHGERERPMPEAVEVEPAEPEALREWFGHGPWWRWSRASGDWGGARTRLENRGVTFEGSYTLDWQGVWAGGVSRGAGTRSALDFNVSFDSLKLAGYEGGTLFADFYSTDMRERPEPGSVQSFSSLETGDNVDQLAELWYEQVLLGGVVRVKAGKIDANSEFAFTGPAGEFVNGSAAISPNLLGMPTWPDPATGATLFVYPCERCYLGGGFFDGALGVDGIHTGRRGPSTFFSNEQSDDWYWIGEAGLTWDAMWTLSRGRVGAGVWHHTGEWERFDGELDEGTTGFYLVAEQLLWDATEEDAEDDRGVWAFGQYAHADESISEVGDHVAAGLVVYGTFAGREEDSAGMYVSWARLSDDEAAGFSGDEWAIDWYYEFMLTPFISLKPDVQWFINPGGDPELDDAVVGGLRVEVTF